MPFCYYYVLSTWLYSDNAQVQATVRDHVTRWKDGRHFQQATRVSIFVSAGQDGADATFLGEAGDNDTVEPTAGHSSSVGSHQRQDRDKPVTQLPLLPLHTIVDIDLHDNETRN